MAVTNNLFAYLVDALDAWKNNNVPKMTAAVGSINALGLTDAEINSVNETINIEMGGNFVVNEAYLYALSNLTMMTDVEVKKKIASIYSVLHADYGTALGKIDEVIADTDTGYINASTCTILIRICLLFGFYDRLNALRDKFLVPASN